ncbi:MAG: flagellar biosynthesis protein FlhF [Planctomycetota bacterium]|nr:MAG: flagellar biosynthesis protein FlhF [Planctomycetota bacterium]REK47158.1 MAG: flagellar biosynthesis protein FlhF [Planctomycetota bacterium]
MDVKTFRAGSMRDALQLVRRELGPDAAVLSSREIRPSLLSRVLGKSRQIEVTASLAVEVPPRAALLPRHTTRSVPAAATAAVTSGALELPARHPVPTPASRAAVAPPSDQPVRHPPTFARQANVAAPIDPAGRYGQLQSMVDQLRHGGAKINAPNLPPGLFELFTDLIEGDVGEPLARELVERAARELSPRDLADPETARQRVVQLIRGEIQVSGSIELAPGTQRLVALVGPTGVGKTTTIAKLAANFRIRQQRRVGLITVDTYRIAAVDQLQTYADIIDLPMEVVSTPREMTAAVQRLREMDLVLLDTAGRSPRDEVKIQELKAMLGEAAADEVHLVLAATAGASNLVHTAQRFAEVGTTSLILTKLDEAVGLGNVLPLVRETKLPLSYVTNGQNVPDDIEVANPLRLASAVVAGWS